MHTYPLLLLYHEGQEQGLVMDPEEWEGCLWKEPGLDSQVNNSLSADVPYALNCVPPNSC